MLSAASHGSLVSCTTSSHCSAPGEILQKLLSLPHKSLVPHPCSNLMERGQEMKTLPGTSNSSQPLLHHRALPHAHFSREKRLGNPFVSCLCCSCSSSPLPRAPPELPLAPRARGAWTGVQVLPPLMEQTQGKLQQWEQTQLNKQPRSISHRKKEHVENFSFNRERDCLSTWQKATGTEQSTA